MERSVEHTKTHNVDSSSEFGDLRDIVISDGSGDEFTLSTALCINRNKEHSAIADRPNSNVLN